MTNLSVMPFSFESNQVRTIIIRGEPWFIASDVCAALNISNVSDALYKLDDDEKLYLGLTEAQKIDKMAREINIISESGMFTLVLRCRDAVKQGTLPHRFRKWVTNEVLPSIRKTGSYGHRKPETLGDLTGTAATAELAALVDKLQRIIHEGEFIPAGSRRNYNLPANRKHEQTIIRDFLTKDESSTILMLLAWLRADGFDMTAAEREIDVIRGYVGSMRRSMGDIQTHAQYIDHAVRVMN
ncbi:BRO family protein [Sodalis endosymbiont of Spalangia cameroni]|uniref:BRO-N domain-containing protein n=1 Tax=Sodalis praecaptivus TaxID=1239307 RepID=UPI0031F783E6